MLALLREMGVRAAVWASNFDPTLNRVNTIFLQINFTTINDVVVRIAINALHLTSVRTQWVLSVGF